MSAKYCQGPNCHTYMTVDRKRGPKGAKYYQTRTVGRYGYGDGNFCTLGCQTDWWNEHGTRAVDHFGKIHQPIRMTEENAWIKDYDYKYNADETYCFRNRLTNERLPITKLQYDNETYTLAIHQRSR